MGPSTIAIVSWTVRVQRLRSRLRFFSKKKIRQRAPATPQLVQGNEGSVASPNSGMAPHHRAC
jgi:hypothetical protein